MQFSEQELALTTINIILIAKTLRRRVLLFILNRQKEIGLPMKEIKIEGIGCLYK